MKILIKSAIIFAISYISLSCASCSSSTNNDNEPITPEVELTTISPLRVEKSQLVDRNGDPIILHGVSFGWHQFWPRFYNAKSVETVVDDWGADVVRASMGIELDGGYIDNPKWSKGLICDVIDAAIDNDVYVIVDWHSHNINLTEAKEFFSEIATEYKGVPNIIYEIFNEPDHESWVEVKSYSKLVIKTIRDIDPNALILVGSPTWDQDLDIVADNPITEYDNLMYTLHFYAATHKADLRRKADYAISKGIPIFISECAGMEASGNGYLDEDSWNEWRQWADKNSLSWVAWSISDKDETCSMLLPAASDGGPWSSEVLKPWAQIVIKDLKSYQN